MTAPTQPQQRRLTPAQIVLLIALIDSQAKLRAQLTQAAVTAAVTAFRALTDWWDAGKVDAAIRSALKIIQPNQRQAARITDAYLARSASLMTGRTVRPAGVVDVAALRRQIPPDVARDLVAGRLTPTVLLLGEHDPDHRQVIAGGDLQHDAPLVIPRAGRNARLLDPATPYGRVAEQYRLAVVSQGASEDHARQRALVRVAQVAATDVTLAVREQVRKTLGQVRGITGYRRILRPELSETGPCGLCVVAADRIYKVEHLLPIHDRCVCDVLPIIGDLDPGIDLNADELRAIYETAGSTGGGKRHGGALKRVRVAMGENGELGPVLFDADQHHRGPVEVAHAVHPDQRVRDAAKFAAFQERLDGLLARQGRGEQGLDRAIEWQTRRLEKLRHDLDGRVPTTTPRRTPVAV